MGLSHRRARAAALALLLLAGAACSADGDGTARPPAEETTTTVPPGLGGSRFLAYIGSEGETDQVVLEDLVEGTTATARTRFDQIGDVTVSPSGALAWTELLPQTEATHVRFAPSVDAVSTPASAPDAGCPAWLPDGRLLVTRTHDDGTVAVAEVDPRTGVTEDLFPLALGVCAEPAGPEHLVYPRPVGETYGPAGAEVVRVRTDGTEEEVVGHIPPLCYANDVAVSPDGRSLAAGVLCEAEATDASGLYVGTTDDDLAPLVAEGAEAGPPEHRYQYWHPSWSADGSLLAYYRSDGGASPARIFTVAASGGTPRGRGAARDTTPALSGPAAD